MTKEALIYYGGWEGHKPEITTLIVTDWLLKQNFNVAAVNLDKNPELLNSESLTDFDLIVPNCTMSQLTADKLLGLANAIKTGTGFAGFHGGMADSFRRADNYHSIVGGQFVGHPGDDADKAQYEVRIKDKDHEITKGVEDFEVTTEQYQMHVDPSIHVLADTLFPAIDDGTYTPNGKTNMPVAWTRYYGEGKVFYITLGHRPDIFAIPQVETLLTNGMRWAARKIVADEVQIS
jgi:uncharacterized protein